LIVGLVLGPYGKAGPVLTGLAFVLFLYFLFVRGAL